MADFVVVANRLPVDLETLPDGSTEWRASPGGLVTALAPMLRARGGAWVGWPGVADEAPEPFEEDGLKLHPVSLSAEDVEDYYEGFSNGTLWPLYHDVVAPPEFHRHWWQAYVRVNERFADAVAEVAAEGATVWVQDYQLQLLPGRAARAPPRPAHRVLPAHPVPAHGAVHAAPVAQADHRGAARRRSRRLPHRRRRPQLPRAGHPLHRRHRRARRPALRRPGRPVRRVPDLHRLQVARRARAHARGAGARPSGSAPTSATPST